MAIVLGPKEAWEKMDLRTKVEITLRRLQVPGTLHGLRYLTVAIEIVTEQPQLINDLTKVLYPMVAEECGSRADRVERSMRTAIGRCWERGDHEARNEIAGYHLIERPTSGEFIDFVASYIRTGL